MAKKSIWKKNEPSKETPEMVKEEVKETKVIQEINNEPKQIGMIAKTDINLTYRKGSFVPQEKIDLWKSMGLHIEDFFNL
jgi:hypothetical protein